MIKENNILIKIHKKDTKIKDDEIYEKYEIEESIRIIINNQYKKVSLQFPDELLNISTNIYFLLKQEYYNKTELEDLNLYILGDTSYGMYIHYLLKRIMLYR
jgi:diphthamide synthase subunit DPH2